MSSSSALYFQIHQTAEAFIRSYHFDDQASAFSSLSTILTPDCEHNVHPNGIQEVIPAITRTMSNQDIHDQATSLSKFLKSYTLEAKDVMVDETRRKAVVQAVHQIAMKSQYGDDSATIEAVVTLWTNPDGTAVQKVSHFVDSLAAAKFFEHQQWVSRRAEEREPG